MPHVWPESEAGSGGEEEEGGKGVRRRESGLEQKGGRQEKVEDGCQDGAQGAVRENKQMGALRIFYLKLSPVEYKYGGG